MIDRELNKAKMYVAKLGDVHKQYEAAAEMMRSMIERLEADGYVYNETADCWKKPE